MGNIGPTEDAYGSQRPHARRLRAVGRSDVRSRGINHLGAGVPGEGVAQLGAGRDTELRIQVVEVGADRSV
jgi:hypothetical protein